ncbi:hypothetical protein MC060_10695, partial [Paenibacillus macerans]|nr:hypothetical protein [Paenibacillus macerans]
MKWPNGFVCPRCA